MQPEEAKWRPLSGVQRRIVGVLVEKAKTTPDQYPLSLNGLATGCNQKSNRSPVMEVVAEDLQIELDALRDLGAVVEIQSGGRVPKFKHLLYDWLGVDKLELAVMAELLLRGEQTVGELRGRAARMEQIADLAALRPILRSLVEKGLVIELGPEGRGQTVTHALLSESELAAVRSAAPRAEPETRKSPPAAASAPGLEQLLHELQQKVEDLSDRVQRLEAAGTESPS